MGSYKKIGLSHEMGLIDTPPPPLFVLEDRGPFSEKRKIENVNVFGIERKLTNFILKSVKINEKVNIIFISPETLTSYFDVALSKRNAGKGAVFRVWLFSCNDSMSLAVRKWFLILNFIY